MSKLFHGVRGQVSSQSAGDDTTDQSAILEAPVAKLKAASSLKKIKFNWSNKYLCL